MQFFQSHCGAIATSIYELRLEQIQNFQSHCGAIATRITNLPNVSQVAFNPTVVRLRPVDMLLSPAGPILFQSHCGAIATLCPCSGSLRSHDFQSHCGAIATFWNDGEPPCFVTFNPTVVRLRLLDGCRGVALQNLSIPLWCDCDSDCLHLLP